MKFAEFCENFEFFSLGFAPIFGKIKPAKCVYFVLRFMKVVSYMKLVLLFFITFGMISTSLSQRPQCPTRDIVQDLFFAPQMEKLNDKFKFDK